MCILLDAGFIDDEGAITQDGQVFVSMIVAKNPAIGSGFNQVLVASNGDEVVAQLTVLYALRTAFEKENPLWDARLNGCRLTSIIR